MTYYFCLVVHSLLFITFDFCVLQNHLSSLCALRWPRHRVLLQEARARVCKRSACACGRFQNFLHHIVGVDCTIHFSLDVRVCLFFVCVRGLGLQIGLAWSWSGPALGRGLGAGLGRRFGPGPGHCLGPGPGPRLGPGPGPRLGPGLGPHLVLGLGQAPCARSGPSLAWYDWI